MTTTNLAAFGLSVKPNVAISQKWHSSPVRRGKKIYWEKSKSELQTTFVRRVTAIMEKRGLSDNEVARTIFPGDPTKIQSSISRITSCRQEPSLEKIAAFSRALDVPAISLLIPMQEQDGGIISLPTTRPMAPKFQRVKVKRGDRKKSGA